MLGLLIALGVFGWGVVVNKEVMEVAFCDAASFLYVWYWIWAVIIGIFSCIFGLVFPLLGASVGGSAGGTVGAFAGFLLGSVGSMFLVFLILLGRILTVFGAWLLMTAGNSQMPFSEFDKGRLIAGAIILLIAVVLSRRHSSSSK